MRTLEGFLFDCHENKLYRNYYGQSKKKKKNFLSQINSECPHFAGSGAV